MTTAAREISINSKIKIGGENPFFLIAGPCVIEGQNHAFMIAKELKKACENLPLSLIFKASYDKANRSSLHSYRGPGIEKGLDILRQIKEELELPVLSDVHETWQIEKAAEVLDVIQIPAFLSRQTDLIVETAKTRKTMNIKKGQFLSPYDMKNVLDKALNQGNEKIILTERGTIFGYNNLVFDVRSIPTMKKWGFPVVIDASHSVQKPGGEGHFSGGETEFIPVIAQAGVCVGADGLFLEVHDNPPEALSDKLSSLSLDKLKPLLASILSLKEWEKSNQDPF